MTELTRPIRRLLSRSDGPDATPVPVTPAVVETASAADVPSIAVDIAESDPLLVRESDHLNDERQRRAAEHLHQRDAKDHAKHTVERSRIRHGVEMRSDEERGSGLGR
jgi:hypothetical protein